MTLPVLSEWKTEEVPDLDPKLAGYLWSKCGKYVTVTPPNLLTGTAWKLTPGNWIGSVPLPDGEVLRIKPKLPVLSLLRLLDLAYGFSKLDIHSNLASCDNLEDWFDHLVAHLVRRINVRMRQGLYRAYLPRRERISHVRGRIDLRPLISRPHDPTLVCRFQEHTADIIDNRIFAWTLHLAARCVACAPQTRHQAQAAARVLSQTLTLTPFTAQDCLGRTYHRLNQDYEPLHAICRLVLDRLSPTWEAGDNRSLPFTLDMAALFEAAVAAWLKINLDSTRYRVTAQDRFSIGQNAEIDFVADIVITELATGTPIAVLDTKYKLDSVPSNDDVSQVITYATVLGAPLAGLVYPRTLSAPFQHLAGAAKIRVASLCFPVDVHPDIAGAGCLESLGLQCRSEGLI